MNVLIVYCHPSENSFTYSVKEEFVNGLKESGKSFEISDLYAMDFNYDYCLQEYEYAGGFNDIVNADVLAEQEKIQKADVLVFIYPVFWSEAPAKLVGWFQRVWSNGFAYGPNPKMKELEKALFLVTMGSDTSLSERVEQVNAMKTIMLGDRIFNRAKQKEMIIFDRVEPGLKDKPDCPLYIEEYLKKAYELGENI